MHFNILSNNVFDVTQKGPQPKTLTINSDLGIFGFKKEFSVSFSSAEKDLESLEIHLGDDYAILPAFFNAHDHLLGTYWPRVERKEKYKNWKEWDDQLHGYGDNPVSPTKLERNNIPNFVIYNLGAYKNLISGVTTVMDHMPHKINKDVLPELPIRTIQEYGIAHEVSQFDLRWGDSFFVEHRRAKKHRWPFVTHINEGFDDESKKGVQYLKMYKALDEKTVLVHGMNLSDEDITDIANAGSSIVWCPFSNIGMFGQTLRVRDCLKAGINICLGTDSPLTGGMNFLEEIKFAFEIYQQLYNEELDPFELLKMMTLNPAKAFGYEDLGIIEEGYKADFIIIKTEKANSLDFLKNIEIENIEALFSDGKIVFCTHEFLDKYPDLNWDELSEVKINGKDYFIKGELDLFMKEMRHCVGFEKELPFLPIK